MKKMKENSSESTVMNGLVGDKDNENHRWLVAAMIAATVEDILTELPENPVETDGNRAKLLKLRNAYSQAKKDKESALRWINGWPIVISGGDGSTAGGSNKKQKLFYFDEACEIVSLNPAVVRRAIKERPEALLTTLINYRQSIKSPDELGEEDALGCVDDDVETHGDGYTLSMSEH